MKRAVFAAICLFCIVVWPSAAQISPDLLAMAPAGEVDRLITTREFEINKPFAGDMTLLSSACLNEDGREVVDALLAKGGDPNFKTYGGMTPLMYAASNRLYGAATETFIASKNCCLWGWRRMQRTIAAGRR